MKIEIDFSDEVIRSAVQTWTERAAADALDAYLTGTLARSVQRQTEEVVNARLEEYFHSLDVTPLLDGLMHNVELYGSRYIKQWADQQARKQAKAAIKKASDKVAQ